MRNGESVLVVDVGVKRDELPHWQVTRKGAEMQFSFRTSDV